MNPQEREKARAFLAVIFLCLIFWGAVAAMTYWALF